MNDSGKKHFYFWQNMISMHQSAFLRSLAEQKDIKVTLIVERKILESRVKMGWKIPDLGKVMVLSFEDNIDWRSLINESKSENCYHIFSGIPKSGDVRLAFASAINASLKIGIMAEPLDERGLKGKLRLIKSKLDFFKYNKHINFWLAIGENGYFQYKKVGYPPSKLFHWAYCVEEIPEVGTAKIEEDKTLPVKIMYVGSFIHRKGCDLLIQALLNLREVGFKADFYCLNKNDEHAIDKVKETIAPIQGKLKLLPMIENTFVRSKMYQYDALVLPSRFDGWGAVVNEALTAGTAVLASKNCGASTLIKYNSFAGDTFETGNIQDLEVKLLKIIKKGKIDKENRQELQAWAKKSISGEALVIYFMEIFRYVGKENEQKPNPAWMI